MMSRSCDHVSRMYQLSPAQLKALDKIKSNYAVGEDFLPDDLDGVRCNTINILSRHGYIEFVERDALTRAIYQRMK